MAKTIAEQIVAVETQIAALTTKLAALKAEQEVADKLASVTRGSKVTVKIGRGETAKTVDAEVLAVQEDAEKGNRYKVVFGEGFDTETAVVQTSQIVAVLS